MDGRRVGRVLRALRQQRGWRQLDVAERAAVSQAQVSRAERGRFGDVSLATLGRIATVLDASVHLEIRWDRGEVDRLIDREHAAVVETVVRALRARGWEVRVEYGFNHFGERGSVDVLAWHPGDRALLIVEAKSRLTDIQAALASYTRKVRIVPALVRAESRTEARHLGRLLVMPGSTANRDAVGRHAATFAAAFPERMPTIRPWLRRPDRPMAGIWFVAPTRDVRARGRRLRVRRRGRRSPVPPGRDAARERSGSGGPPASLSPAPVARGPHAPSGPAASHPCSG